VINFATNPTPEWATTEQLKVRETGLGGLPVPDVDPSDRDQLPAGRGRFPVPPHLGFAGLTGIPWRAHYHTVDEALKHSRSNADAMLKDILILTALEDRLRPASQVSWHIEPLDETDNEQIKAAVKNQLAAAKTWKLQEAFYQWNLGKWFGKYGLEMVYTWDQYQPDLMYCKDWAPVNGDSLVPRWANREWGRLVGFGYEGESEGYSVGGRVHWYTPDEMESVVIHSHRPRQPDFYDHLSSGQLRGCGLRHGCYWIWFYRANLLSLIFDYLERLSGGIWKGLFDESNPEARADLERAVAGYKSKSLLSLPRRRDGSTVCDLEIMEVGSASAAIMRDTLDYLDNLLRSYILGQPYQPGNIGGDEVAMRDGAVSTVTKADCESLAEDLTTGWLPTLYRYNSPGVPPGRFVFDTDHPNAERLLSYATTMREMGWATDLDHLAKVCGLPPGTLSTNISTKIQALSPTAVDAPPTGVPIAGNAPQQPATSQPVAPPDPTLQVPAQ
jgi:hypothetical protein